MAQVPHLIGYTNIVGIDASDGMLAAAQAKGCYVELHNMRLGAHIDLPAESFDAVTAAGVLAAILAADMVGDNRLMAARRG